MDAPINPLVETVSFMKPAQIGGTEAVCNIIGYFMEQDPSPILDVEPTEDMARSFSISRLAPMIRDSPALRGRVTEVGSRKTHNTILEKTFPGGGINIIGANSPAQLAGRPKRIVVANDVDRFPPSAGTEGDPLELAIKRTRTFWNRKIFVNSTPTTRGISKIEDMFFQSNQQHYYVPCPFCNFYQMLIFGPKSQFAALAKGMLVYEWNGIKAINVVYRCGNCQKDIPESAKYKMLRSGEWRAQIPEQVKHQGFHINELYSPWSSWVEIAEGFEKAKHRIEKLRTWVNTTAGETFDETASPVISEHKLMERREEYVKIPDGVIMLTAFIDAQEDRLECYVEGWGLEEENWLLDFFVSEGSPAEKLTWNTMESWLVNHEWIHQNGYKAAFGEIGGLIAVGVDTGGHHTTEAYKFVRKLKRKRFFAMKGVGGFGRPIITETKSKKVPVRLILVGVDEAKQIVYDRLAQTKKGPGFQHFNKRFDKDYFDQLLSERKVIKVVRGRKVFAWELLDKKRRNEGLDCKVGNLATLRQLNPDMQILREKLTVMMEQAKVIPPKTIVEEKPTEEQPKKPQPPGRRKKNWVTNI